MKRLGIICVCVLLMVSLIGCSPGAEKENILTKNPNPDSSKKKSEDLTPVKKPKGPPQGWIKKISISKQQEKEGTALKIKVDTNKPLEKKHYLSYKYWKNGAVIMESETDTLAPAVYKKGDLIFVDVVLNYDDQVVEQRRSEMLQIENSSPIIKQVNIPGIEGPGIYRMYVKAGDPDGDEITFSLAGDPLHQGLEIDPQSGTVTLVLDEKNPPPEEMKFTIVADDGDKGIAKKLVTIKFNITRQEENQEGSKS